MRFLTFFAAGAIGLLGCGGDDGPSGPENGSPAGGITIGDNFFNPETFTATVGTAVVWTWTGTLAHNVTFEDQAPGSGDRTSGTFSRTFTAAGSYDYFCTIHGAGVMDGTVTVSAADIGGGGGGGGGGGSGGGGGGSGGGGGGGYPGY
jgi:plastocyanin